MENSQHQHRRITSEEILTELQFSSSRSGGPGGQNVNKVNTKVTLRFDVKNSSILSEDERSVLLEKLASKITTEGVLVIASQDQRSQLGNKEAVLIKLDKLLRKAFEKKKKRKATKPSKTAVEKRINEKKKKSEKKQWRQKL